MQGRLEKPVGLRLRRAMKLREGGFILKALGESKSFSQRHRMPTSHNGVIPLAEVGTGVGRRLERGDPVRTAAWHHPWWGEVVHPSLGKYCTIDIVYNYWNMWGKKGILAFGWFYYCF